MPSNEWLTTKQLADELQVPVDTIYQWRLRGDAPRGAKVGRYIRYRRRDVDKWIESHLEPPTDRHGGAA